MLLLHELLLGESGISACGVIVVRKMGKVVVRYIQYLVSNLHCVSDAYAGSFRREMKDKWLANRAKQCFAVPPLTIDV